MADKHWQNRHRRCFVVLDDQDPETAFILYCGMSFQAAKDKAMQRGFLALYQKIDANLQFVRFIQEEPT